MILIRFGEKANADRVSETDLNTVVEVETGPNADKEAALLVGDT
jgi:hypothetical protein